MDIVGALSRTTDAKSSKYIGTTYGFHMEDGQLSSTTKGKYLNDTEYKFPPGLCALIMLKQ